jgi:hypothetical protein
MAYTRLLARLVLLALVASCGGGGGSPSAPTPVPTTETFSGTTRQTATTCTGDSHDFTAAEGSIAVRLIETSDLAGALSVQVCAGGIDNGNCSIKQQKIAVGQTLTGTRIGVPNQNLKLLAHNCVFGGPPIVDPVTYRVSITYQR